MENKLPAENLLGSEPIPDETQSFFEKIKSHLHMPDSKLQIFIPILIVIIVLVVGGGGTYIIAAQVLKPASSQPANDSGIASVNLPTPTSLPTLTPTSVPAPTLPPAVTSPTPVSSAAANWVPYNFSAVNLNFSYPPGWFINLAATSGAPYLYVQNFAGNFPSSVSGNYAISIGRLEQVGITTVGALETQLALNDVNPTFVNGVNVGTPIVSSASATTINGYAAYSRYISYSSAPSVTFNEVYVLDGITNVVRFAPMLDVAGTQSYFNTLLSTIQFTN